MNRQPLLTCSIIFLLLFYTVLTLFSAMGTYHISVDGSKNLLKTKATDIAISISFALERVGLKRDLFFDMISKSRWDDVAYLALYDANHTIVLHSNPKLIGTVDERPHITQTFYTKHLLVHDEVLATGEKVFVLDFPVTLHVRDKAQIYCLRVALHPYPAEAIVRKANYQLLLIGISLVLLWLGTLFFLRFWQKNLALEQELREKEKMAALGEMAAVLAHEIRNPLSSIKGFAQVYQELAETEEERSDFSIIIREATRLERLTTNLLIYSKPLTIRPESFSIGQLCEDLRKEVALLAEKDRGQEIEVQCDQGGEVVADREGLRQILLNLIQNAIDATKETQHIRPPRIAVRLEPTPSGLTVTVDDNGPGISKEHKEHMFEPFFTTKTKGTGLGLAIVKRLVDKMGGEIRVEEKDGPGARIVVFIPSPKGHSESARMEKEEK